MSAAKETTDTFLGTGRRKKAIARVRLSKGSGKVTINGREAEVYCQTDEALNAALAPLTTVKMQEGFDITIKAQGGGVTGQAGAIALGIARALQKMDLDLRAPLKKAGHLKRDPRMKERKKSGQPGARKSFQFSKR